MTDNMFDEDSIKYWTEKIKTYAMTNTVRSVSNERPIVVRGVDSFDQERLMLQADNWGVEIRFI